MRRIAHACGKVLFPSPAALWGVLLPFLLPAMAPAAVPQASLPRSPAPSWLLAQSAAPRADLMDRAAAAFLKADYTEAIALWSQVISSRASQKLINQALENRAKAYLIIGQPALALVDLEACRYDPSQVRKLADLWLLKGSALLQNKQYREAIAAFAESQRLQPATSILLANRSVAYQSLGDIAAARTDLIAAIKLQPSLSNYFNFAVLERQAGNHQSCYDILSQIITRSEPYAQLFAQRSLCAAGLRLQDQAISDGLKAVKLDPANVDALQQIGLSLIAKNQKAAAKPYLLKASALRLANGQMQEYQKVLAILSGLDGR